MFRWSRRCCGLALILAFGPAARADVGATTPESIDHPPGFRVELLYTVPAEEQGSWVSMTIDDRGRLITSDQYGKLYRLTLPGAGSELQVEPIGVNVGMAQGLLYAFDSLYVCVNASTRKGEPTELAPSGLYRLRDTNGDDRFDDVQPLRALGRGGEHGPHSLVAGPDGKSIYLCCGNHTPLAHPEYSLLPRNWSEDFLLSRLWDPRGHARGILAPGGWIARLDPDGGNFTLFAGGFRNQYDAAFSPDGELFTYDSDMEWDVGMPWYRPTRVNHVVSGGEYGWRSGTCNWPDDYPDSLGSVVDVGPGSPTGVVFGTGAKFPAKYQRALFIADWSYGVVHAVHLEPDGASYRGTLEKFLSAQPLPVTDMVVHTDGALYFLIGGRYTQSGLYRVSYVGEESTEAVPKKPTPRAEMRAERRALEQFHVQGPAADIDAIWPSLASPDRSIRYAARVALEHQPVDTWRLRIADATDANTAIQGVIALARCGNATDHDAAIEALNQVDWTGLVPSQQLDLLRAYELVFIRLGAGSSAARKSVLARFDGLFPSPSVRQNRELATLLVYLDAPKIAERCLAELAKARTQEEQIQYAFVLKDLAAGWTPETRESYFQWFNDAASLRGGMSFGGFLANIKDEAVASLTPEELDRLQTILSTRPVPVDPLAELKARPFVKKWTVDELEPVVDAGLAHRNFERGRELFSVAGCFKCHRVRGEGGTVGPDLTGAGGRFNSRNLLESIIDPSKVVSDQYEQTQFILTTGKVVVGRVVNMRGGELRVLTDMFSPSALEMVKESEVELMQPAKQSMMPEGLLDRLTETEVLDLVAYLKSGGDRSHEAFDSELEETASGLRYRILETGADAHPGPTDRVLCHYRGWLDNGDEFDSSYKRGEPAEFPLNAVIAGWTEGLQLIGPGGKIELEIPASLGYGKNGHPPVIPQNATLHFEVELIEVR